MTLLLSFYPAVLNPLGFNSIMITITRTHAKYNLTLLSFPRITGDYSFFQEQIGLAEVIFLTMLSKWHVILYEGLKVVTV